MNASKRPSSRKLPQIERFADRVRLDENKVPEPFRHLIPYAKFWSIGDDMVRSEVRARTPLAQKKALVDAVWPHWDALHAWCSSKEHSDEGLFFGMLIEAVAEARLEVYPETRPKPVPQTPEERAASEATVDSMISQLQKALLKLPGNLVEQTADLRSFLDKLVAERTKVNAGCHSGGNESNDQDSKPRAAPDGSPSASTDNSGTKEGPPLGS